MVGCAKALSLKRDRAATRLDAVMKDFILGNNGRSIFIGCWAVSLCTISLCATQKQSPKAGILESDDSARRDCGVKGEPANPRLVPVAVNGFRLK